MDRRIKRTPRMAPVIVRTTNSSPAPVSALIPHSRTAYNTSSTMKTRGSVTHPFGGIEPLSDRAGALVRFHTMRYRRDLGFRRCRLLENLHGRFRCIREVEKLQIGGGNGPILDQGVEVDDFLPETSAVQDN